MNWSQHLSSFIFVIKIQRHYLYGNKCKIYFDHKILKYFFTQNELKQLELIKEYDYTINYHPNKTNMIVNALSRKSMVPTVVVLTTQPQILMNLKRARIEVVTSNQKVLMASLTIQSTLRIKATQKEGSGIVRLIGEIDKGVNSEFHV